MAGIAGRVSNGSSRVGDDAMIYLLTNFSIFRLVDSCLVQLVGRPSTELQQLSKKRKAEIIIETITGDANDVMKKLKVVSEPAILKNMSR